MNVQTILTFLILLLNLLNNNPTNNINPNLNQINFNNQVINNNLNNNLNGGDFNIASETSNTYYLRIILEGIERERATSVPFQKMDGYLYCNDKVREGIIARNVTSYDITQISVPVDCNNPAVLLNIPHWLNVYVYLTSTNRNNPQEVIFKSGDVNKDNIVDDADLLKILFTFGQNWQYSTSADERPDLNLDGIVNDQDQELVSRNFGSQGSNGPANYSLRLNSDDLINTSTPPQNLSINIRCSDNRSYFQNNENYILGTRINLNNIPNDCNQPQALIYIPHFLKKKVYLRNNQEVNVNLNYGDTNLDNIIDDSDLLNILFSFNQTSDWRNNPRIDLNFNGQVNDEDQRIVLNNFGQRGDNW